MPVPLPSTGYSLTAAKLLALQEYLRTETGFSWLGSATPPSQSDTLIGTIRPFAESMPMGSSPATTLSVQLVVMCRSTGESLTESMIAMESWKDLIVTSLHKLRFDGVSGVYGGVTLDVALQGIQPTELGESQWSQISSISTEARSGSTERNTIVRLLMNYRIVCSHPGLLLLPC